ncbi:MAG TPA: FAD-dependent monooxygenase [Actinomycetota bacterium]|nr:FAD-dependent monooxygenase [Actinomycetota bacterium]
MRIAIVGGGPAGCYLAALLKRAGGARDVTVIERNPAGATYGWGVVFSDRTLTSFRDADYRSYVDITDRLVTWDAIDIHYGDHTVRCGGMTFSGIARTALLGALQDRCRELGVDVEFERELAGVDELDGYDVVVGADGVRSTVRDAYRDRFGPRVEHGRARYIWFGTNRPLDAFNFVFRADRHGLFQAHAYPYDGTTSTFIVECHESTWRRAGLDEATEEESIAYAEKLFAPELAGHGLMSNKSAWISFPTLRNRTWRAGNVVLVGDAAHTAHFSIGSGTKLAMEDAIALANALDEHDDVDAALAHYEAERRPVIERFQDAALQSQRYFESTARYVHMEPEQFAFHLLTRSGRIDYGEVRVRDRSFVATVDAWFARRGTGRRELVLAAPPAFAPLRLAGALVVNRIATMPPALHGARDGMVDDAYADALTRAALTGAGLVLTDAVAVSAAGRVTPGDAGMYDAAHERRFAALVDDVHARSDALVAVQLGHAGRRAGATPPRDGLDRAAREGWPLVAPSPLPYRPRGPVPRAADRADLDSVRDDFAAAAAMALRAGADVLQLHMAHGYLLASFLSPLTNRRDDEYGGDRDARMRYPLEVFDAVRAAWPRERPLSVALPATDWERGGWGLDDAVAFARALRERGCDLVQVLAGWTTPASRPRYDPYFLTSYCDRVRNEAGVAAMTAGHLESVDEANTALAGGRADLCLLRTTGAVPGR